MILTNVGNYLEDGIERNEIPYWKMNIIGILLYWILFQHLREDYKKYDTKKPN